MCTRPVARPRRRPHCAPAAPAATAGAPPHARARAARSQCGRRLRRPHAAAPVDAPQMAGAQSRAPARSPSGQPPGAKPTAPHQLIAEPQKLDLARASPCTLRPLIPCMPQCVAPGCCSRGRHRPPPDWHGQRSARNDRFPTSWRPQQGKGLGRPCAGGPKFRAPAKHGGRTRGSPCTCTLWQPTKAPPQAKTLAPTGAACWARQIKAPGALVARRGDEPPREPKTLPRSASPRGRCRPPKPTLGLAPPSPTLRVLLDLTLVSPQAPRVLPHLWRTPPRPLPFLPYPTPPPVGSVESSLAFSISTAAATTRRPPARTPHPCAPVSLPACIRAPVRLYSTRQRGGAGAAPPRLPRRRAFR
jgi:hypothetical protein